MKNYIFTANNYLKNNEGIRIFRDIVLKQTDWHEHEFIEIAYVLSGEGIHFIENQEDHICEGDFILINFETSHKFVSKQENPLKICNCIFRPLSIDDSFSNSNKFFDVAYQYLFHSFYSENNAHNYINLSDCKEKRIKSVLENMLLEYENKESGYLQILKSELKKMLIMIFRLYIKEAGVSNSSPLYNNLIIEKTFNFLKEHYNENIKCEDVARQFYLSAGYFGKIFKIQTGTTVAKTLQNIRINKACEMLEEGDEPVVNIASAVGYSDLKYFYTIFTEQKGMPPGEYRKLNSPK